MRTKMLFIPFALALLACGPQSPKHMQAFDTSAGVIGGSEVLEKDPIAPFIVGLYNEKTGSRCTGTLIAEDMILTAGHCVDPKAKKLSILFSQNLYDNGRLNRAHLVPAHAFLQHSKYNLSRNTKENAYDLALVHFKSGLPKGYQIVTLSSDVSSVAHPSAILRAAGYGVSNGLFNTGGGTLRQIQLPFSKMHSETEIQTVQTSDKGVCSGDSGGPLFLKEGTSWIQVGVASRVATKFLGCRGFAVYTRVDLFEDWITKTVAQLRSQL